MKRILGLLLCVCMVTSLAACGSSDTKSDKAEGSKETVSSETSKSKEATIEETVIYDANNIKITAKEFDLKGTFGPELKVLIENNSDKTLTFQTGSASINGYMVDSVISSDVTPGKKVNDGIFFYKEDLEVSGITQVADIQFKFHIIDSETWDTVMDTDMITLKTSIADGFKYEYDESGDVIYDNGGIKVISKGLSDRDIFGPGITLLIINNSAQDITIQTRNSSINGFMIDSIFSSEVLVGKHCASNVTFMQSDLDANGIKDIENVEFSLHIFNMDSWDTITDSDTITLTFTK